MFTRYRFDSSAFHDMVGRQLKMRMNENGLGLTLYKRHVGDIKVVMSEPRRGLKFAEDEGRVIFDQNLAGSEREMSVQADRRCRTMLQELGNRIHP